MAPLTVAVAVAVLAMLKPLTVAVAEAQLVVLQVSPGVGGEVVPAGSTEA